MMYLCMMDFFIILSLKNVFNNESQIKFINEKEKCLARRTQRIIYFFSESASLRDKIIYKNTFCEFKFKKAFNFKLNALLEVNELFIEFRVLVLLCD